MIAIFTGNVCGGGRKTHTHTHNETNPKSRRVEKPCATGILPKRKRPMVSDTSILFLDKTTFYEEYHIFTKKYGIRDLPMYSCRHTTATALALAEVVPSVIQKVMRHAKFSTTQKYIHPDTKDALDAINKL